MTEQSSNDQFHGSSFLQGHNAEFIEQLYAKYAENPDAVDDGWREYFAALSEDETDIKRDAAGPSWARLMLIRAYRHRGHLAADLDPLGLAERKPHPELEPKSYGFTDDDLDRPIFIDNVLGLQTASIREIVALLKRTYCGTFALQYMHI